jgi:hypothetical protein
VKNGHKTGLFSKNGPKPGFFLGKGPKNRASWKSGLDSEKGASAIFEPETMLKMTE